MNIPSAILRFLAVCLGMDQDAAGKEAVARAVQAAMRGEGIQDLKAYEQLFAGSSDVRQRFIDAVVVGETWFFRDRGPFTCLARHSQEVRNICPGPVLRILSAPCATGEEPYSIVMTLLAAGFPPSAFAVEGVDISVQALSKARQACYRNGAFRGHIGEDVARFIEATPDGRRVTDSVARQVSFHHGNLLDPESLSGRGPYAVIFCRNLLIYLTADARRQVFELLDRLLLPGGLLFAGHTETVFWHQRGYIPLQWERAFALTKPVSVPLTERATAKTAAAPPIISGRRPEINARSGPRPEPDAPPGERPYAAVEKQPSGKPGTKAYGAEPSTDEKMQEARLLADRGNMDGAMHLCQEYSRTVGPAAETFCLMGVIHMATGNMKGAEDCFLKALYLQPGHYESLVHLSLLYRQKGDERKAALFRERAVRQAGPEGKTMDAPQIYSTAKAVENIKTRTS